MFKKEQDEILKYINAEMNVYIITIKPAFHLSKFLFHCI